jgi:thiamine biosynthesis protein ThiS
MIQIAVNGEPRRVAEGATLLDLLGELDRDPRLVAVERNGDLVRRPELGSVRLAEGDRVEVVQFVQGG